MKKLFFLSLLFVAAGLFMPDNATAQSTMTASKSTLTNTDAATFTYRIPATYGAVSMQLVVSKTSGTVAGTAVARASIDGTNYVDISSDTLTLANQATNTYIWKFDKSYYLYYQISLATSGTMVVTASAKLLGRQ